ncbi:MAG: hypothetical protein K2G69_08975, partial [Muribaculaceae bacterium]|nr:hypothetical protein [Muribaculaceae bacterium]
VRDYQGNNVAVMDGSKNLIQESNYYPYGEPWREPDGQPWLYGGNERLRLDGINEYDFNARRYNSAEGRFSQLDPLCEKYPWFSPYAYCAGDPVNLSDPTGLFPTEEEAKKWAKENHIKTGFLRHHKIEQDYEGTWVIINRPEGYQYYQDSNYSDREDGVVKSALCFDKPPSMFSTEFNYVYNSSLGRSIIPDFIQVGIGYDGIVGVGASCNWELNWVLRGPERSWKPIVSMTAGTGTGFSIGTQISFQSGKYVGPADIIRRNMISTTLKDGSATLGISGGPDAIGRLNVGIYICPTNNSAVVYQSIGIGIGIPAGPLPLNGSFTATNTFIIKDWY